MKNSLLKLTALLSLSLALTGVSKALTLDAASADTVFNGPPPAWGDLNVWPNGWLYGYDGTEFGTQANVYSVSTGGTSTSGFTITVTFDIHPTLSYARLHAGGQNQSRFLIWDDAADFATFNASTDLSITFHQNFFMNVPRNAYTGISGIGLQGTPGTSDDGGGDDDGGGSSGGGDSGGGSLPDSGQSVALLGLGVICLGLFRRMIRS